MRNLVREFVADRAGNALLTVVFLVFCVLEFGALAVLSAERSSPDANITNASDAIWWAYVTITTVGYGDQFPVTNAGRLVGVLVMTAGVGLFGTLSGFLANTFLTPPKKKEEPVGDSGRCQQPQGSARRAQADDRWPRSRPPPTSAPSWRRSTSCSDRGWPSITSFWVWPNSTGRVYVSLVDSVRSALYAFERSLPFAQ